MRFREWRIRMGLDQNGMADQLGVSQGTISMWESGYRMPRPRMIARIMRASQGRVTFADWTAPGTGEPPISTGEATHEPPPFEATPEGG